MRQGTAGPGRGASVMRLPIGREIATRNLTLYGGEQFGRSFIVNTTNNWAPTVKKAISWAKDHCEKP